MKLLLTSDGITNKSIAKALFELVGKPPSETRMAFIPTAIHAVTGDCSWFVDALQEIRSLGLKHLDIVDFSAISEKIWLPKLEAADVIFVCGGHSTHLMKCIKEFGFKDVLIKLLENKVYAGLSAGCTITGPDLRMASKPYKIKYKELFGYESEEALQLLDFYVQSHLNSPVYPDRNEENLREISKTLGKPLYAIDRNSALKVVDGKVEVISEGEYFIFNG